MYEDIAYPAEVAQVMAAVLSGNWSGPDPEKHIDKLLYDFINEKAVDRDAWMKLISTAVKQLGCIDCVYARLNLECILEPDTGSTISIRYNRVGKLPGENHGPHCRCGVCVPSSPRLTSGTTQFSAFGDYVYDHKPTAAPAQLSRTIDGTDYIDYPECGKTEELEKAFYASEKVVTREAARPGLNPERKLSILQMLRSSGFPVLDDREKAFARLAKLLRTRSVEQNIISRIAYLIIFQKFRMLDGTALLRATLPMRSLPMF